VVEFLAPYTHPRGPLRVRKVCYKEGRSNVLIEYPPDPELAKKNADGKEKVISFVGCHLDVVAANADDWEKSHPPFQLTEEGDKLYGRGVTDCLGHVAMMSCVFKQLAVVRPRLQIGVWGVFIANEEASAELGVGADELEKRGELRRLKSGPLFWVDSANFGPTLATGGAIGWELTVSGKLFHSGLPHKAINTIEAAMEAVRYIQERFYKDFPSGRQEAEYLFDAGSSLKPTKILDHDNTINQIPGKTVVQGDIRVTPFYTIDEVKAAIERYVKELDVTTLRSHGWSKFELPAEKLRANVKLDWLGTPYKGVACDLKSPGYRALSQALQSVNKCAPFSLTGSLPVIKDLQDAGFDVQVCGFGRMDAYHANNEYGYLSEFVMGSRVVSHIIDSLNRQL